MIFPEIMLDILEAPWYIIQVRGRNKYARTAMKREIASKDGNFRGVCPVIGRLNCFCSVKRISLRQEERVGLGRPFFMARSDTHGGADSKQFDRTQTLRKLST